MKLFSRSSSTKEKADFSRLKTDMHSHLLPGIDDGSPSIEASIELIRGMADLGYSKLITTPHIMWDMYKNTPAIISEKLAIVQSAVKERGLSIEINAAAEYFLDDHVESLLKNKEPLLTISGKMVLVEISMASPSLSINDILFELQMQGYQPVIAHPERYIYLESNKEFYDELRNRGCLFQLNLLAINGYYGKSVQELAQYLIKKGYYDLIGTDLHHQRHLEALKNPELSNSFKKILDTGKIINSQL